MEQRKLAKYDLRAVLGRGAAGIVYEGWDPVIARRVAIKTVRYPEGSDTEAADMLAGCRREAQAAGRLSHPNIVGIFDYGETDDLAYIVMEFVDGRTLKAVLDSGEHLSPTDIVRVMTALLAGLQYSHDNGVIHRDIKPANIMLTRQGQVKIADFGIARLESSEMTRAGTVIGTPAYMSPEQFIGDPVDRRTDIYAAGVVLFQLVTGKRPFDGTMASVMHKVLNTEPPRPSDLSVAAPGTLDAVVAKAMAKRPEDRFDSADSFASALQSGFAGSMGVTSDGAEPTVVMRQQPAPVVPVTAAVQPTRRTPRMLIAIGGLMLLAAAGATAWRLMVPDRTEQQLRRAPPEPPATSSAVVPTPRPVAPSAEPLLAPNQAPASTPPLAVAPSTLANAAPRPSSLTDARALALTVPCALIEVSDAGASGGLRVSGPALPGAALDGFASQIRGPDRTVDFATDRIDRGLCSALEGLGDAVRRSRQHDAFRLIVPDAPVPIDGRLTVTVPAVPDGELLVDLYAADGSVHHLARRMIPSGAGGKDITVTAPAPAPQGLRVLSVIAAPARLDLSGRPLHESAAAYLQALQGELARVATGAPEARAEIALLSVIAAVRMAAPPSPPAPAHARTPSLNSGRCADIVARTQLGEPLSDADHTFLRMSCGP